MFPEVRLFIMKQYYLNKKILNWKNIVKDPNNKELLVHLNALFLSFQSLGLGFRPQRVGVFEYFFHFMQTVMTVTVADSSWAAHTFLTPQPMCHNKRVRSQLCQDSSTLKCLQQLRGTVHLYLKEKQYHRCQTCSRIPVI